MPLQNYTELQASVADWLNRADLVARIPDFIRLAEATMSRKIRHPRGIIRAPITVEEQYVPLPTDFLQGYRFQISTSPSRRLNYRTPDQVSQQNTKDFDVAGPPVDYTIIGRDFEIIPPPNATYTGVLSYYAEIPSLGSIDENTNTITTNWVLQKYPDAYLFGALTASAPFLKADDRLKTWIPLFSEVLDQIEMDGEGERHPAAPLHSSNRAYG